MSCCISYISKRERERERERERDLLYIYIYIYIAADDETKASPAKILVETPHKSRPSQEP